MFKALKYNKIIAINETGDFPCLVHDSVEEDTEHQLSDYIHCDGQFVLTVSDEAIEQYKEQVRAERDRRIDAIRWRIERYQTQEAAGLETNDTADYYRELLLYVQALRDIPTQAGFPDKVEWPEEPTDNIATPSEEVEEESNSLENV